MKKHLLFKFLLTFSLALFTVGWVNGQEILDNWTLDGGSISYAKETSEVHGGSASVEITWTSTSNQYLNSEEFAVTAGQTLEISTWVYDNDAAGRARLCVMYTGASSYYGGYSSDGTSWEELTYSGTVPTGATAAYIQIRFYDVSPFDGDATVLVDDVSYIMNGGSNVVTNPGFENWSVQPIISNIAMDPGVAQSTDAVTISTDIDPNTTTVNSVAMNWGTTSGSLGNNVTMTNSSGNTWTADSDIPTQSLGTEVFYEIVVTYNTSETLISDEQSYIVSSVTEVADIATLRAGATDGTIYKLTGEAVLTFDGGGSRNQKFIEDATAGILIDDAAGTITTSYNVGDGITGIFGTLSVYNGITQFIPEADPGATSSTSNTITPQEITISEFETNYADYESEIIKFVDVNFNGADGTGTFSDGTDYTLGDGSNTTTFRYSYSYSLDYDGNTIPHESINVTLVGIGSRYNTTPQFYCRNTADMTIPDYIVITSPADNTTFDTETNVTVDFVTYNQTDNLKLQVWIDDFSTWEDQETGIDPATGTITTTVPANATEASTYKLRLIDETDSNPISNEVPFAINDISGPVLDPTTPYNPADGSTDVSRSQVLTINFDEEVQAGSGNILIKKTSDDTQVASYDVTSAPEINISGTTVTITNGSDWPNYTDLYVEMASGVIVDMQNNNQYSLTKGEWNFVTVDEIGPISTFNPADAATDVARNTSLTISFDEPIYAIGGATFDNTTIDAIITLKETDAAGADVAFDATINGTYDVITINPTANFSGLTDYYYAISNLHEDAAGNQGSSANATFTTIDDSAPLVTITPTNGSTDIDRDTTIAITFDKAVRNLDDSPVVDGDLVAMITLKEDNSSGADVSFTASINVDKDSISVVPDATLKAGQDYYVSISADLESETGTAIAATNATFTTIDDEAPIATFNPADAATDIAISSNITITMNEAIQNTDASAIDDTNIGALITLKDTDGSGSDITFDATIDVNKKIITITPVSDFDYNQDVYVALAAVEDALGNESSLQTATFTTIPNNDASLSDLTIGGETIKGFDAATYNYNYTVAYGTTTVPTVAAVENDPDANAVVTQATNLDGTEAERTATIVVTAEDGSTELTYSVIFKLAPEKDLFFSEYVEGSGNNKAIEIYNPNSESFDLSEYTIKQSHNGTGWGTDGIAYVLPLEGILAAGEVYVVANADADASIIDVADTTFSYSDLEGHKVPAFNGNDALGLFNNDILIDVIGVPDVDPGSGWDVADTASATGEHTIMRKYEITMGNTDWATSAGTNYDDSEWIVFGQDFIANLGLVSFQAPAISNVTLDPTTPTASDDVTVSATITDGDTETANLTANLMYGSAEGSEDTDATFAETATTGVFEGTIPASASTVYYKITASDEYLSTELTGSYSITTGIGNPDGIVSMNIFPNPSNGLFTIEMNASKAGTFNVEIFNIQGQVVYNKEITQDGFYKGQIDISKEATGIYYIRINDGNNMKVSKIMIQ